MSTWKGDALVIALCAIAVAASAAAFGPRGGVARFALVETRDGRPQRLALDHDVTLVVVGHIGTSTIEVRDGRLVRDVRTPKKSDDIPLLHAQRR